VVAPGENARDRRQFLRPLDPETLGRGVRNVKTETDNLQLVSGGVVTPTPPPVFVTPPPDPTNPGTIGFEQLTPEANYPLVTPLINGGNSNVTTFDNNVFRPLMGGWCLDTAGVLGQGAGALVVPRSHTETPPGSPYPNVLGGSAGQGLVVYNASNLNSRTLMLTEFYVARCFFFSGYLFALTVALSGTTGANYFQTPTEPANLTSNAALGAYPGTLRRYNPATDAWQAYSGTVSGHPGEAGGRLWYGLRNATIAVIDPSNIETSTVIRTPANSTNSDGVYDFAVGEGGMWWHGWANYGTGGVNPARIRELCYRPLNNDPSTPVTDLGTNIYSNIFYDRRSRVGHVDANGRWWLCVGRDLLRVGPGGTIDTYTDVLPETVEEGLPIGQRSELVASNRGTFYMGGMINSGAIGGDPDYYRAAIWEISVNGSETVWIDEFDAAAYNSAGTLIGGPLVTGLSRTSDGILLHSVSMNRATAAGMPGATRRFINRFQMPGPE
jgi:hypothetical protein